jgi:hypothetical protein
VQHTSIFLFAHASFVLFNLCRVCNVARYFKRSQKFFLTNSEQCRSVVDLLSRPSRVIDRVSHERAPPPPPSPPSSSSSPPPPSPPIQLIPMNHSALGSPCSTYRRVEHTSRQSSALALLSREPCGRPLGSSMNVTAVLET